jgi:succinate dehydrogenase/fumarate reductase flavoprotein subunit
MRIVELILDEEEVANGIDAISIVSAPAIESNFVALKEQEKHKVEFATVDADKRILMGPALIPDKPIYRNQDEEEFYVYFSKNTVKRASELYLMRGNQNNATLEHEFDIQGLSLVESWVKEDMDKDKSALYNLNDPIGTWMVSMKVDNPKIWDEYVKTGMVKGFSIEGFFAEKSKIKASKHSVSPDLHEYIESLGYEKI